MTQEPSPNRRRLSCFLGARPLNKLLKVYSLSDLGIVRCAKAGPPKLPLLAAEVKVDEQLVRSVGFPAVVTVLVEVDGDAAVGSRLYKSGVIGEPLCQALHMTRAQAQMSTLAAPAVDDGGIGRLLRSLVTLAAN
jgi:hypothetical protein